LINFACSSLSFILIPRKFRRSQDLSIVSRIEIKFVLYKQMKILTHQVVILSIRMIDGNLMDYKLLQKQII